MAERRSLTGKRAQQMGRGWRKGLSVLVAILMVCTMVPLTAVAVDANSAGINPLGVFAEGVDDAGVSKEAEQPEETTVTEETATTDQGNENPAKETSEEKAPASPTSTTGTTESISAGEAVSPSVESEDKTYTLYLNHVFRFTVDGKGSYVSAEQTVTLTDVDFTNGICDLSRFAYSKPQLTVTAAGTVSVNDFDQDGEGGAQITYGVNSGWKIVRATEANSNGIALREVFAGAGIDDYEFVPAKVVNFTMKYEYSSTGALAGSSVFSSDTVEAEAQRQADGTYVVEWVLPSKEGFRIVMDAAPLNAYLVNPPTGNETPEQNLAKLENGDYNVNVNNPKMPVFYEQEHPGVTNNPTYNNEYSDQYNEAWNKARVLTVAGADGYTAMAVCGGSDDDTHLSDDKHGASALVNPKIRVVFTEAQMNSVLKGETKLGTITVNYRRNATTYTVNHWVPRPLTYLTEAELNAGLANGTYETKTDGSETYVRFNQDKIQGRVGALTKAEPKTTGRVYEILTPDSYSQEVITNSTEINLYYHPISPVRVIFDTDYTYIPRQQITVGENVDFKVITNNPKRLGYTFGGWQYLKKDAEANPVTGEYKDSDYVAVSGSIAAPSLTVSSDLLAQAKIENVDGMLILHLYPKWTPAEAQVRVVFWTEDLAGSGDDVQAFATGGNPAYYNSKYADYSDAVKTSLPNLGHNNADHYSNMGSFTFKGKTGDALTDGDGNLVSSLQTQINNEFEKVMKEGSLDTAPYYTLNNFEIVTGSQGESKAAVTVGADGKTTIYVYYTRNVYELKFHYFGKAAQDGMPDFTSPYAMAVNTTGFSYSAAGASAFVKDGVLDFGWQNPLSSDARYQNRWMVPAVNSGGEKDNPNTAGAEAMTAANMTVPQTITVRAKYGADLTDIWPVALPSEWQYAAVASPSAAGKGSAGDILRMISWATTAGPYRDTAYQNLKDNKEAESTIMGIYGAMGSEIIADPTQPYKGTSDPGVTHHLIAYWNFQAVNYFTNNHCYELPDLDINSADVETISIYNNDKTNVRNLLYLVPRNNPAIAKYGFTDLMPVSYEDGTGVVTYDDPAGTYYAVREYNGKFYAVAQRVETVSTAGIQRQNPSARLHMTRANDYADHDTQFAEVPAEPLTNHGQASDNPNNPYQLYFYYNRDWYDIIYMVPSSSETSPKSEFELGKTTLPYGALVTKAANGFELDYKDSNDNITNWTPTLDDDGKPVPVCPDRGADGTKPWAFIGWALGPSGANMQWSYQTTRPAEDDFAIQGNLRVYAMWQAPTYTVTFDYAGGAESGSTQGTLTQEVSANTRYSASGVVPRPLYPGHTLQGWYKVAADGTTNELFDFDANITADQKVVAKWTESTDEAYGYTVNYVSKTLSADAASTPVGTVEIDGETWYIIKQEKHEDILFSGKVDINIAALAIDGYIPVDTNKVLEISKAGTYTVNMKYEAPEKANHEVRYVLAGTENNANPTVVLKYSASAAQVVTTPDGVQAKHLVDYGYELVNPEADGTYKKVEQGTDMLWVDSDGNSQPMATLTGDKVPSVITYLVQPLVFTVSYVNAPGSPQAADAALKAVTAPQSTNPGNANGKNPTCYITTDTFAVANPARVQQDGKWYVFSHWSLGTDTEVAGKTRAAGNFASLKVDPGTVGNLEFVANWVPEDDGTNGDGNGGNDGNGGTGDGIGNGSGNGSGSNGGSGADGDGSGQKLKGKVLPRTGDTVDLMPVALVTALAAGVALLAAIMLRKQRRRQHVYGLHRVK